jgi:hypothetical protein
VRRRAVVAISAVSAVSIACSLTSLDGLSNGASPNAPDASQLPGDATAEGAAEGGGPVADAQADAPSFCETAPAGAFCDDFEDGLSKWQSDVSANNTLVADQASSTSATHSAFITVSADGSSCLSRIFPGTPQTIVVDADVRFDGVSGGGSDFDFLGLRGGGDHNLTIELRGGIVAFDQDIVPTVDGGPDEQLTPTGYALDSAWHHFHWENHLNGSTAEVTLSVDGTKIGSLVSDTRDYASPLKVDLGDCVANVSGGPWKVRFDNVVVVTK